MEDQDTPAPRPPEPPRFGRQLMFDRSEKIGIPLLLLLPVLALFGVFGDKTDEIIVSNPRFEVKVNYPKRIRYKLDEDLEIVVRNIGAQPLNRLTVALDQGYLSQFSDIRFNVQPSKVTRSAYEVQLDQILPGETRLINVELTGKHFGHHDGRIEAISDDGQLAQAAISTLIFP